MAVACEVKQPSCMRVQHILLVCLVFEVRQARIGLVAVPMVDLHTWWRRADESAHNQNVNLMILGSAILAQLYGRVPPIT